jgi:hypothetical protein
MWSLWLLDDFPIKKPLIHTGIYHTDFFNIFNLKYLKVFYTLSDMIIENQTTLPQSMVNAG